MIELKDKLKETLAICSLHYKRMNFAWTNIKHNFPLTEQKFGNIEEMEMALFDQTIYRFTKLQDSMGSRLFIQVLEALQEETANKPFIDLLNQLEKLELIESASSWIELRQVRNALAHEYPSFKELQVKELNLLPEEIDKLTTIWKSMETYCLSRFNIK